MKLNDFTNIILPERLKKCPIVESVFEVRFSTTLDDEDAVYGALYSLIRKDKNWSAPQKLPVAEIPPVIRRTDPNLKFSPHRKLSKNNLLLQIGPAVLSLVSQGTYPGSKTLFEEFDSLLDKLQQADLLDHFIRIGVRYIDFFDMSVFDALNCDFSLVQQKLNPLTTQLVTVIDGESEFKLALRVVGDALSQTGKKGSVLDIDASKDNLSTKNLDEIKALVRSGHLQQKKLFYSIINEKFLNQLEPEYEQ